MSSSNLKKKIIFFRKKRAMACRHRGMFIESLGLFIVRCRRCRGKNQKQKLL